MKVPIVIALTGIPLGLLFKVQEMYPEAFAWTLFAIGMPIALGLLAREIIRLWKPLENPRETPNPLKPHNHKGEPQNPRETPENPLKPDSTPYPIR